MGRPGCQRPSSGIQCPCAVRRPQCSSSTTGRFAKVSRWGSRGCAGLLQEAISCLEYGLKRSAIVVAWAGFFQLFAEKLFAQHEAAVRTARPKWGFHDLADLMEQVPESQILDVAKDVRFHTKSELRVRQGQLSRRNQCAHPTLYRPSSNEAIGYVDEMIQQSLGYV